MPALWASLAHQRLVPHKCLQSVASKFVPLQTQLGVLSLEGVSLALKLFTEAGSMGAQDTVEAGIT